MARIANLSIGTSVSTGGLDKGLKSSTKSITNWAQVSSTDRRLSAILRVDPSQLPAALSAHAKKIKGNADTISAQKKYKPKLDVDTSKLKNSLSKSKGMVSSWAGGVAKIAAGVGVASLISKGISGIGSAFSSAFTIAIETEQTEISFTTLLGSADKAKAVLSDLRDFGASTPFEFPELATAGKQLIAFGFSTDELLPQMRQLGDVAAGLGIPYSELAELYGKMKVGQKIMAEDLNQLQGRGIDAINGLSKVLGVLPTDIKKMASEGKIEFEHVQQMFANLTNEGKSLVNKFPDLQKLLGNIDGSVNMSGPDMPSIAAPSVAGSISTDSSPIKDLNAELLKLESSGVPVFETLSGSLKLPVEQIKEMSAQGKITGQQLATAFNQPLGAAGQFAGMMDAQSKSVGGLLSTLRDNISLTLGSMGEKLIAAFDIKERIAGMIVGIQTVGPSIDGIIAKIVSFKPIIEGVINVGVAMWSWLSESIGSSMAMVSASLGLGGGSMQSFLEQMVTSLAIIEFMFNNWSTVLDLGVTTAMHGFVKFGNYLTHLFTVALPTVFMWWVNEGFGMMKRATMNYYRLFWNLGKNIVSIFSNLWGLIRGSVKLEDIMTPLTEGMQQVVQTLPKIPERVEGDLEKALKDDAARIRGSLTNDMTKHIQTRLDVAFPKKEEEKDKEAKKISGPALPPIEAPKVDLANNENAPKFAKLAEVGSNDARETLLRHFSQGFKPEQDAKDIAKEQLEIQKQQLAETKRQRQENRNETENVFSIA